jgi:dihydroorotate dehydrogenase (NAD+) catalytic subunit
MINAVGLSNQGIDQSMPLLKEMIEKVHVPVIISFFADTDDNYAHVAKQLVTLKPPLVEMNASCPNTEDDFGMAFALSENALQTLTRKVRAVLPTETKLIVKLSPNVPNIGRMGQVAEAEGADAICAINTVPGMVIDVPSRKPVLTNVSGGISGDVIRPIAVKAVYDLYKAVKIPIIGTGGVSTGEHALEMMMAGATLVGVGSAVYSQGVDVFSAITTEMQTIMKRHGIVTLSEIIGAAHA